VADTEVVPVERVRLGTETHTDHQTVGSEVCKEEIEVDNDALQRPDNSGRSGVIRRGGPPRPLGARRRREAPGEGSGPSQLCRGVSLTVSPSPLSDYTSPLKRQVDWCFYHGCGG
jgi:Domain of unknown function (DUF2382)